jgi:hypothetical protein
MSERTFPSTSDGRTANNAMRHQYRILSEEEKSQIEEIKDLGAAFTQLLHRVGRTIPPASPDEEHRFGSGNLTLAFRHVEDAVYRAVKHVTR